MKRINTLLYTLLAGFATLFATSADAQTWNFTKSSGDEANFKADASNWTYDANNNRFANANPIDGALTANGQKVAFTDGLLFNIAQADGLRIDIDKRLTLNKTNSITIPGLKAGQVVTVEGTSSNKTEGRSITATNLSGTTGFGDKVTSETTITCTGTVDADGDVVITNPEGGFYLYSIKVQDEGEVTPPAAQYNDVALNTAKNQMRLTLIGNELKYYNTDDVRVAFDRAAGTVTVTPNAGTWQDVFTKTVSNISFALAQPTGGEGDIQEGEIKITEAKGWQESLYAKWEKYSGAASYNVYYKGGKATDWTKIDQQLVRDYGSYARADVVGLVAGSDYAVKVVAVDNDGKEISGAEGIAGNMTVVNYDRSGYAHFNRTEGVGAYNNDGSLKKDAVVLYITNDNFNTITCDMNTGNKSGLEKRTGLGDILQAFEKGKETRPFAIRFIGQISDVDGGQLMGEAGSLQIKGKGEDTEANVTFEGIGDDATWYGWGMTLSKVSSVEIRNIATMLFPDDGIQLKEGYHVWVHNNDIFYGNTGGDSDQAKGDGSLDTKDSGSYNTFSYNHFWDSGKCSLCGMKGEATNDYETYHHNWFDHADSRMPRVRTKTIHVYNNYYDGIAKYGVGATMGSSVFVENNYFRNTKYPMLISKQGSDIATDSKGTFSGEDGGIIKSYGNVFAEKSSNFRYVTYQEDNTQFDAYEAASRDEQVPSSVKTLQGGTTYNNFDTNSSVFYVDDYAIDAAAEVPSVVTGFYGAGRLNHGDFAWSFDNAKDDADYGVNTALKSALQKYATALVGIYGDENAESGEQGSEGGDEPVNPNPGGDEGGEDPDEPETPVVTEGDIYASFVGGVAQSNVEGFFTVAGSQAQNHGSMTVNGETYETGLKLDSKGSLSFTPSEDMTMTLYFRVKGDDAATITEGDVKVNGETEAGNALTEGGFTLTMDVAKGTQYAITKGSAESYIFYISLESKDGGDVTDPDEGGEEEPVDPNPGEDENPDTPVAGETITCDFTGRKNNNESFFTINGSYSNSKGTATVNGQTYSDCLKIESSTSIMFTTTQKMTLKLYFGSEDSKCNIKINGEQYDGDANNVITATLEAGSYELTKKDSCNLFYIELIPAE